MSAAKTQKSGATRRDFLILSTSALGAVGAAGLVYPFISSMNPSADVLAMSTIDVDVSPVQVGQAITVMWRGKPVFIRRRSAEEIEEARVTTAANLPDPEADEIRTPYKPEWLIVVGVCTHLGCVPLGQKPSDPRGEYNGWFCPCHGSHYDTSGRIRKGPAPTNLMVPDYKFLDEKIVRIGVEA